MDNDDKKAERDKLATAKLNAILEENKNRSLLISEFSGILNKIVKIAVDTGKNERESVIKSQLSYKRQLIEAIDSTPLDKALELLNGAKSIYERYIIDAKIRRDDFSVAASNIKDIIDPLIEEVKRKIEAEILIQKLQKDKPSSLNEPPEKLEETIEFKKEQGDYFLPDGFSQIVCRASKKEIQEYFYILTQEKNKLNDQPFMSKQEVDFLLQKNFAAFECKPTGRTCKLNLVDRQKAVLRYFVYEFYLKYEIGVVPTKRKYVNFLIWNFDIFKDDNPDILNGNMNSSKKPKKYRIPVENYLDK